MQYFLKAENQITQLCNQIETHQHLQNHRVLKKCQVTLEVINKVPPWKGGQDSMALFAIWNQASALVDAEQQEEVNDNDGNRDQQPTGEGRCFPHERGGLSDGNYFGNYFATLDGLGVHGANPHCSPQGNPKKRKLDQENQGRDLEEFEEVEAEYLELETITHKALVNATALYLLIDPLLK